MVLLFGQPLQELPTLLLPVQRPFPLLLLLCFSLPVQVGVDESVVVPVGQSDDVLQLLFLLAIVFLGKVFEGLVNALTSNFFGAEL